MDPEEEQKQLALAKRRILEAADATTGLIGDPLEFLLNIIEWGEANGHEEDASFLRRRWYEPQLSFDQQTIQ